MAGDSDRLTRWEVWARFAVIACGIGFVAFGVRFILVPTAGGLVPVGFFAAVGTSAFGVLVFSERRARQRRLAAQKAPVPVARVVKE